MIKLWEGYVICADEFQYILAKPIDRKSRGKITQRMTDPTYHATLKQAVLAFYHNQLRKHISVTECTLDQVITASGQIESRLHDMLKLPNFDDDLNDHEKLIRQHRL